MKKIKYCLSAILLLASLYTQAVAKEDQQFLILNSPGYEPGLFSVFNTVLGLLERYDEKPDSLGLLVDFRKRGLYYDKAKGSNWWEYYFEPIVLGNMTTGARPVHVSDEEKGALSIRAERGITRQKAHSLIKKYIRVKPHIQKKIEAFADKNFKDHYIIGIHYRGTDKFTEAPKVMYQDVYREINNKIAEVGSDSYKIFIATDEQNFLDEITLHYPGKIIFIDAVRSLDAKGVHNAHRSKKNNYKKGEEAVIDCLLLSRCNYLIRTASNLSTCSSYFNPDMPVHALNQLYAESK